MPSDKTNHVYAFSFLIRFHPMLSLCNSNWPKKEKKNLCFSLAQLYNDKSKTSKLQWHLSSFKIIYLFWGFGKNNIISRTFCIFARLLKKIKDLFFFGKRRSPCRFLIDFLISFIFWKALTLLISNIFILFLKVTCIDIVDFQHLHFL